MSNVPFKVQHVYLKFDPNHQHISVSLNHFVSHSETTAKQDKVKTQLQFSKTAQKLGQLQKPNLTLINLKIPSANLISAAWLIAATQLPHCWFCLHTAWAAWGFVFQLEMYCPAFLTNTDNQRQVCSLRVWIIIIRQHIQIKQLIYRYI